MILGFFWAVGSVFASSLASVVMDTLKWRYYLLIVSTPLLLFLIGSFWIPESPRYLLSTGQVEECKGIIDRIAESNGKISPKGDLRNNEAESKHESYCDIMRSIYHEQDLFHSLILLVVMMFTTEFCYYGFALLTTSMVQTGIDGCHPHPPTLNTTTNSSCQRLTDTDYIDLIVTTLAEFPGVIVGFLLINSIGRRNSMLVQLSLATLSFLLLAFCTSRSITTILVFITRAFVSGCVQTLYVYSSEVLPTNVRGVGVGIASMIGRSGAIVTPLVAQVLIHESFYWVIVAYAVPLVSCALCTWLLKIETNQRLLQDRANDVK